MIKIRKISGKDDILKSENKGISPIVNNTKRNPEMTPQKKEL